MGIDLRVYPVRYMFESHWTATDALNFDRNDVLFQQIRALPAETIKKRLCIPTGLVAKDHYDNPLWYVSAEALSRVELPKRGSPWTEAVIGFLYELPPETPIVLYWH